MNVPKINWLPVWVQKWLPEQPISKFPALWRQRTGYPVGWMLLLLMGLNIWVGAALKDRYVEPTASRQLYLLSDAARHFPDTAAFAARIRSMAIAIHTPPDWIMAIIHHESKFNPHVTNYRGSGATGLIQFMPPALMDLNDRLGTHYYMSDLRRMDPMRQLDLVQAFFEQQIERGGPFTSLGDMYAAVLFPRARGNGPDYVLFRRPSLTYRQNKGLDENRDGAISLKDLHRRMSRKYPHAYRQRI
jgi:hypothetical protein